MVITRFDQADDLQIARLEQAIHGIRPDMPILRTAHRHTEARSYHAQAQPVEELKGKKVFVFCGIGNPGAFVQGVESLGCTIVGKHIFDDHHPYTPQDLEGLASQAQKLSAELMLTTEKDWVKAALLVPHASEIPLLYLTLKLEFLTPPDTMIEKIDLLLNSKPGKESQ